MTSIIYVGMDVHTTNFTFCCYTADSDRGFAVAQTEPDYRQVIKYMERVQKQRGEECKFVCGYEAGCLGYSLYPNSPDAVWTALFWHLQRCIRKRETDRDGSPRRRKHCQTLGV